MYIALIFLVLIFFFSMRGYENAGAVFVGFYSLTAISGYLGLRVFTFAYDMPFKFGDSLSAAQFLAAEKAFFIALLSFVIGYTFLSDRPEHKIRTKKSTTKRKRRAGTVSKKSALTLGAFLLSLVLLISAYNGIGIIERVDYLPESINRVFKSLGILLTPAVLIYAHHIKVSKITIVFLYLSYFIVFFGMGSRSLALLPVSYLIANFVSSENGLNVKKVLFAGLAAILCISIALSAREAYTHGVYPYIKQVASGGLDTNTLLFAYNYGTAYSYSLTAYLLDTMSYDFGYFWTSVDPRLGSMIDWPNISLDLKVNRFVPYNTISELFFIGWPVAGFYYFLAGAFFAYCERFSMNRSRLLRFIVAIFVLFFTLYSLQYNLRSATRIIYYLAFLLLAYQSLLVAKSLVKTSHHNI